MPDKTVCPVCQTEITAEGALPAVCPHCGSALPPSAGEPPAEARAQRRVAVFSDGGFIMAALLAVIALTALYIFLHRGKDDQIARMIVRNRAGHVMAEAAKKKNASAVKKAKEQMADKEKERQRRKHYKPQKLVIGDSGYPYMESAPNFVLNSEKNVCPGNSKNKVGEVWTGAYDLSVKIWLGHDAEFLYMRADVTDNVHRQAQPNNNMWRDDSLQFMFCFDGWNQQLEIGAALGDNGKVVSALYIYPQTLPFKPLKAAVGETLTITRENGLTRYEIKLPLALLKINAATLKKEFKFNALVNDTDDIKQRRKCWMEISEGIATHKDMFACPRVTFRK